MIWYQSPTTPTSSYRRWSRSGLRRWHDLVGGLHPHLVLDRARDAAGEVELRRHGLARLDPGSRRDTSPRRRRPWSLATAPPSATARGSRARACRALAEAPAASDDHGGVLDGQALALGDGARSVSRAWVEEYLELGRPRPRRRRLAALHTNSKVPERMSFRRGLSLPADVDVDEVLQGRPLADQRRVAELEVDESQLRPAPRRADRPAATSPRGPRRRRGRCRTPAPVRAWTARRRAAARRCGERGVVGDVDRRGAVAPGLRRQLLHAGSGHDRHDFTAEL